jgi:putative membrane protein
MTANLPTHLGAGSGAALRDYLAEERTLLAWVRTGLALMGFGFVVTNFGLGDQLHVAQHGLIASPYALSQWFGATLIGLGAAVNLLSARRYVRIVRELDRDQQARFALARGGVAVALLLALVGFAMFVSLVLLPLQASA